jgi:hypothetical protein
MHAETEAAAVHAGDVRRNQLALGRRERRRPAHQPLAVRTKQLQQIGVLAAQICERGILGKRANERH